MLFDFSAYISVLSYPTYITVAKLHNITNHNTTPNSFKTLTDANQTDVPILHYLTLTLNTTNDDISRDFIIPIAVTDIKYNIFGTQFFEEYTQKINIQACTKPELVGHRHHFLLGLGGTGTRWDIISETSFFTWCKMPKIDKETI